MRKSRLDLYLLLPLKQFITKRTSVGLLLIFSAAVAMIVANSPLAEQYHNFWKRYIYIGFEDFEIKKNLLHWINDGLMSIFFFVVGLELKREIMHGQLSNMRNALLPIAAAIGGMVVPALIYFAFNGGTEAASGWGIPMATDIAFALGILYLLGNRAPMALKVFLTAVAIVDDLGAVLVIAFFYTADISLQSLSFGAFFLLILITANVIGIRNTLFYAIMGIGGLWLAILLSGVHATIAAVLAAFTIPTSKKISTRLFLRKARLIAREIRTNPGAFRSLYKPNDDKVALNIEKFKELSQDATSPLKRLEHGLHNFVSFVVLPIFAFANAGVTLSGDLGGVYWEPVTMGVLIGLVVGKIVGVVAFSRIMVWLKISRLPNGVKWKHIMGVGLLAGIGFTMSLFITELAFDSEAQATQAKIGILSASFLAGALGFFYLKGAGKSPA